jgi:phosphorylcholine metabolism protein LicD
VGFLCRFDDRAISASPFLNVSTRDATGIEWLADQLLSPVHYILAAKEAIQKPDGSLEFGERFCYKDAFWLKTTTSIFALPPSLILGSAVKGLSLFTESGRNHYFAILNELKSDRVESNLAKYKQMGIQLGTAPEIFLSQGYLRRPGDEKSLFIEKEGLKEITEILNEAKIPWWVDCGTCLGAYRYGGVIPWDEDIDIAILLPDFHNVKRVLNQLPKNRYAIQDWSSRDHPDSFLKIYIKESKTMIDIYSFEIIPETKTLQYILSLETNMFFPEWWKIRERRFKAPVAFDDLFPLKRALFDGVEVFVPNNTQKYLQRCYGENLDPAKIYDPSTNRYEKDLSHPYWQRAYAH